jgi:hypothetical protein
MEAVPQFGCALLPEPPQPPTTNPRAIMAAAAVAVSSETGTTRTLLKRHIAKLSDANTTSKAPGPRTPGTKNPRCEKLAEVVTVSVVLAVPFDGVTTAELRSSVHIVFSRVNWQFFLSTYPS